MSKEKAQEINNEQALERYRAMGIAAKQPQDLVSLSAVMNELGLSGEKVKAAELVDQTFIIRRAKPFESSFQEQEHAYFCWCTWPESGEPFTTVLGGAAVVDTLDMLKELGVSDAVQVTLRQNEGGKYGQYYTIE